eukprot:TRINITY_DN15518_c0_g2_i1.p1 TRINITY_DN15518_c0_g2~~TRINITY_DN15518_c0_g2_i1.p1  ORF type:complete len:573 (+),score=104.49 TRINITY_DN15518_c0_g2_i1:24-1742(+)
MAAEESRRLFVFAAPKAGMASADANRVGQVTLHMSKNSSYYQNEIRKDKALRERLATALSKPLSEHQRQLLVQKFQQHVQKLLISPTMSSSSSKNGGCSEFYKQLNRMWIHVDMDMFYAAVAIRDNPSLKGKPVAVGGMSMISTANYEARTFGVRSAMPGFIAKVLCPELIFVPTEFDKYKDVADEIRSIFIEYDPDFDAISLDEAAMDVTDYANEKLKANISDTKVFVSVAEGLAQEIRTRIFERTQLTASAGVACNRMLSKICSDYNKPNGQKVLVNDPTVILDFMRNLPVRKIPGVGKVTETTLSEVGIQTCGEIPEKLPVLYERVLTPRMCLWLLEKSVGLGGSEREDEIHDRKSVSVERTFRPISSKHDLENKCHELALSLAADVAELNLVGKCLTIKLKMTDFSVRQRSLTLPLYISTFEEIYANALKLLHKELPVRVRLMGLRLSSFKDCSQPSIDSFFTAKADETESQDENQKLCQVDDCPKSNTVKITARTPVHCKDGISKYFTPSNSSPKSPATSINGDVSCPVCSKEIRPSTSFNVNRHIDECLKKRSSGIFKYCSPTSKK